MFRLHFNELPSNRRLPEINHISKSTADCGQIDDSNRPEDENVYCGHRNPTTFSNFRSPQSSKKRKYKPNQYRRKKENLEQAWLNNNNRKICREALRNLDMLGSDIKCMECDVNDAFYTCSTCATHVRWCLECITEAHYSLPCHNLQRAAYWNQPLEKYEYDQSHDQEAVGPLQPLLLESDLNDCKCNAIGFSVVKTNIRLIGLDAVESRFFLSCRCKSDAQKIISFGYWPCSPEKIGTAISIQLLKLYRSMNRYGFISMQSFTKSTYNYGGQYSHFQISEARYYALFNKAYIEYRYLYLIRDVQH
jgi:hypothetical protein